MCRYSATAIPIVLDDTGNPQRALIDWCSSVLEFLRGHAHLIRKTIAEAEERPDAACAACEGPNSAAGSLVVYLERLRDEGVMDDDVDLETPVSMFMSALFGDALYRDVMPHAFPQPAEAAPAKYVETFMRAVGIRATALPARSRQRRVAGSRRRGR